MPEKWEEFYDLLHQQLTLLHFGERGWQCIAHRSLVACWLQINGLGKADIQEWFAPPHALVKDNEKLRAELRTAKVDLGKALGAECALSDDGK